MVIIKRMKITTNIDPNFKKSGPSVLIGTIYAIQLKAADMQRIIYSD